MKNFSLLLAALLLPAGLAFGSIVPTRLILQKTVENAGSGIYAIDQEVQFSNGEETLSLKETWLIDSERNLRLTVTGGKDLQNSFKLQFLYTGGQKLSLVNTSRKAEKIPEDFLEKYLNFRSVEAFANALVQMKIIPTNAIQKKPAPKSIQDLKYEPEPWVRLSRTGGTVTYALGTPSSPEQEVGSPGIWIEQDHFVVRKLRLPLQVEMSANNYNQFSKGLFYPRQRTIRWANNTVTIRLISASPRPPAAVSLLQPNSLDSVNKWDGLENLPAKNAIVEFYTRFR